MGQASNERRDFSEGSMANLYRKRQDEGTTLKELELV